MKRIVAACIIIASMLAQTSAEAANLAYLYLTGSKSGEIKGGVTQRGRENSIGVIAVEHEVKVDGSGRRHSVFTLTKEVDRSSPTLYSLLANNENLPNAEIRFWTPQISAATGTGTELQYYTIVLSNARITDIKFRMANIRNPDLQKYREYEEVSFTYETITWLWTDGGIKSSDAGKF